MALFTEHLQFGLKQ